MKKFNLRGCEWLLALLVLVPVSFMAGRCTAPATPPDPSSRDTVVVCRTDTVFRERPVYYARRVTDTMVVAVHDTLRARDTLYMELPREQVEYRDTAYRAWISGYRPALDSIEVYRDIRTVTITKTERIEVAVPRRWSLGVTAGYGLAQADGHLQPAPFVGVGVSYNIFSW